MAVLEGGFPFYATPVGILLLDARFPRPPGDIAYAETFDFPVLYRIVHHATPSRVVDDAAAGLVEAFCDAARELEAQGVRAICTSCGFLALHQPSLAASVNVPVFTSSLLQVSTLLTALPPERKVGVLTISAHSLTPAHFAAVGVPILDRVVVAGLEDASALYRPIMDNRGPLDVDAAAAQVVAAAVSLAQAHPEVAALVLECTNLPPYAGRIQQATGLPVWDVISLVRWVHQAVRQPGYPPALADRGAARQSVADRGPAGSRDGDERGVRVNPW